MVIDMTGTWGFGVPLRLTAAFVLNLSVPWVYFILSGGVHTLRHLHGGISPERLDAEFKSVKRRFTQRKVDISEKKSL